MKYLLLLSVAVSLSAQDAWKGLEFLKGDWVGEGTGAPGESAGGCSFTFDLQGKVVVRKNYAESPTFRHEDLMVIYLEKDLKAIYFDNEGHVIHYTVETGPDSVRFLSEQYRLTYRKNGEGKLSLDFDIAPAGKPFSNYLRAMLRRK